MKVALPVVRGLHGSRTEGTTRRFKVGDFKTEFNGLGVLRTDIRTVPGRRRGDRIGERMSASLPSRCRTAQTLRHGRKRRTASPSAISPPYSKSRSCQAFAERYDFACRRMPNRS